MTLETRSASNPLGLHGSTRSAIVALVFALASLTGCHRRTVARNPSEPVAPSDETNDRPEDTQDGAVSDSACTPELPIITPVLFGGADVADVLFVIDDSSTMADEQAALRADLSRFFDVVGVQNPDLLREVHVAVVSSDLGAPGVPDVDGCLGNGDDGILQYAPSTALENCLLPPQPAFIGFAAGAVSPEDLADDFGCITTLGTDGCRFGQPLEAALKALWPASDERVSFIGQPDGLGTLGHGEDSSRAFLHRDEPGQRSIIAVIVVSDKDDCSALDPGLWRPSASLDPSSPADAALIAQGLDVRCNANPKQLFDPSRYVAGLQALRPGNEQLVLFAAIVGVPPELVNQPTNLGDAATRAELFAKIGSHPAMQPTVDDRGTAEPDDDGLLPSCEGPSGPASPPRRIVDVVEGFGANGIVRSICEPDLSTALAAIGARIAAHRGTSCLDGPLSRGEDHRTRCELFWRIPLADSASNPPPSCSEIAPFLLAPEGESPPTTSRSALRCRVAQLAVAQRDGALAAVPAITAGEARDQGWFYDDFSHEVQRACPGRPRRIAFTPNVAPPPGVTMSLECKPPVECRADPRSTPPPTTP